MVENKKKLSDGWVFGLDIGTRNIVGVVGYFEQNKFKIAAMSQKEHETRAMLDGQIHDIYKVGETIRSVKVNLEKQLDRELSDVCIAAAGRVLKTINIVKEYEFEEETRVTQEHIYSLNLLAVEEAHSQINEGITGSQFYCVGNTPVRYMLNDFDIKNLEGHKAVKVGVELIATFLPEEVVDGLYEAVGYAGLQVANLTLEPIAAINIAIPEQFRLLNIALIDVGAGTSDICITKDGSIVSYGMIPFAGDEITEVIAKKCLIDFNSAEVIKMQLKTQDSVISYRDIMGLSQQITAGELIKEADGVIDHMAKEAADKILEINGGKPTSAVFVIGGGGKIPGYTEKVAKYLSLPPERVAVRGEEVLTNVDFLVRDFEKDSLYVTPIGICTNYYSQKTNFVFVTVNGQRVKLYDNNKLTIIDAVMQMGFPNENLFPRRGKELNFTMNGNARLIRGTAGEGAYIKLNGRSANLNSSVIQNDSIEITASTAGDPAELTIGQLPEHNAEISFQVDGKNIVCPRFAYVNKTLQSEFYSIRENDEIKIENYYTVEQVFRFLDLDINEYDVFVNNEVAYNDTKVYENFSVRTVLNPKEVPSETPIAQKNEENIESLYELDDPKQETAVSEESMSGKVENVIKDIYVIVNQQAVRLTGKNSYVLVDMFDFYDFDLSKPQGNIVIRLNGEKCEYVAPLQDGDSIEIFWEN